MRFASISFVLLASLYSAHGAGHMATFNVTLDGVDFSGSYTLPEGDGPFPAIVIASHGDYEVMRAGKIAEEWGFIGVTAEINGDAGRMDAAVAAVEAMEMVDGSNIAAFGYGTPDVLAYAVSGFGFESLKAIVSFHGDIAGSWLPEELQNVGPKLLILSAGEDTTAAEIIELEKTLDAANATWEITRYSGVGADFTVVGTDAYDEWADMRSWESAHEFISEAFGITEYASAEPASFEDLVTAVEYNGTTDGLPLKGWLSVPTNVTGKVPAVVILPDWDGVNDYEQARAVALAELGYVAFAADIFGADKQFIELPADRGAEVGKYAGNPDLYFSRIQDAINQVKMLDSVDTNEIALIGYCFGGSGANLYAMLGGDEAKVAVAFHGSFNDNSFTPSGDISPYLLVLSGGDDGLHGNQTIMEDGFNSGNAKWEITRYAGVLHGYTVFGGGRYNMMADARSWDSMLKFFEENLVATSPTMAPTESPDSASNHVVATGAAIVATIVATLVL